jgi:hypothetical protein
VEPLTIRVSRPRIRQADTFSCLDQSEAVRQLDSDEAREAQRSNARLSNLSSLDAVSYTAKMTYSAAAGLYKRHMNHMFK